MIRINLLPVRAAKKKESTRFQLTVAGLVTLLVLVALLGVWFKLTSDVSTLQADIKRGEDELAELKKKVGKLVEIKDAQKITQSKLDVVRKLEKGRSGPVEFFTKIASAVPERAWLSSLKEESGVITLEGFSSADEVVVDFMRGLEYYKELGNMELIVAKRVKSPVGSGDVVSFTIKLEKRQR